jgi:hypothetical protein
MTSSRRLLAAVLATAAGIGVCAALPAAAHNPRNTPAGAPRMDLEVMVTPELEGRITPGGTDPLVAVDGFGNRFAVARKEDSQTAVGVDTRARAAVRTAAWAWTSDDDGLTWHNLDTVTRGADGLVVQGAGRDLASAGATTLVAESYGATVLVKRVTSQGKGRLVEQLPTLVQTPGGALAAPVLATNGKDAVLGVPALDGGTATYRSSDGGATFVAGPVLEGTCDLATDPRPAVRTVHAACAVGDAVLLRTSRDGAGTFSPSRALTSVDRRGGGAAVRVDVAKDGSPYVLSGMRLTRLVRGRPVTQDLQVLAGEHAGTSFAVSSRGRIAAAAYHRAKATGGWQVMVALFTPGSRPVWYPFADHDPVTPPGAAPPSVETSIDTDPQGRLQLVWASTFLHSEELGRPLLRNVFTSRSVTS